MAEGYSQPRNKKQSSSVVIKICGIKYYTSDGLNIGMKVRTFAASSTIKISLLR